MATFSNIPVRMNVFDMSLLTYFIRLFPQISTYHSCQGEVSFHCYITKGKGWVDGERRANEAGLELKIALMSSQEC